MASTLTPAIPESTSLKLFPTWTKDNSRLTSTVSVTEIVEEPQEHPVALDLTTTHIKSSPYNDPVNFLDLRSLTLQERLFAFSLTHMQAIRADYATSPYLESFNWPGVFSILRSLCHQAGIRWQRQEFYLVIFRSQLKATADRTRLGELDKHSHEEACASGGLLTYWFGQTNEELRNLATCIWRNREDASAGGKGPWHRKARGAAREMYECISFHTHRFVIEDGAEKWVIEEYQEK